jgi:urease accessory protein
MYDAATHAAVGHQRAQGELGLAFRLREGRTVLDDLRQQGCLKARFPRAERAGWAGAVTLNTSGGVAGGDRLASRIALAAGAQATIASQAAERVYRALPASPPSLVRTSIDLAPGAALDYLPQETILFDGCALDRRLEIALHGDAWFLGVETLVFGRAAMGEQLRQARLADTIRLRHDGRLLLHDAIRLDGNVAAALDRPAVGAGARVVTTLIHAAPDAAARLEPLRDALALPGVEAGVSAWDNLLIARLAAPDGACQRRAVVAGLAALRDGRPLPRVWLC